MICPALLALALAAAPPTTSAPDAGALFAKPTLINSKHFEVRNKEHQAEYTGDVKVVRDTLTMTCDRLIAEYGADNEITRLLARGHVVAIDGDRWAAGQEADYDNATALLLVRGHPQARQGKREVDGELVTFVNGSQQILVTKAKTRVDNQADGGTPDQIAIDADQLLLDDAQSVATWTGHVRARRRDTTMLSPVMTATYDDQGTVTHVHGTGGVEATQGDKWAKGQQADYDARRGMLVVTGNPQARQGRNKMRGTKVIFYQDSDLLEVENMTSIIEVDQKQPKKK